MIRLKEVEAGYARGFHLQQFSSELSVPGAILVLVGPNGSGKSTILKLASRSLRPKRGRVILDGSDVWTMSAASFTQRVAFVPQTVPVGFDFTIREFIRLRARNEAMYGAALESMDLSALEEKSLQSVSGGERQRASIARAFAQNADFLLLDEPTAHLDLQHHVGLARHLRREAQERNVGVTVVLHDLNLAAAIADRVLLMDQGKVVAQGAPSDVLTEPVLFPVYKTHMQVNHDASGGILSILPRR